MTATIGIGLIGFGNWPREAYVPVLRDCDQAQVVAVAARSDQTIAAAREALRADFVEYRDYRDLLADERVDAVLVATPNALHAEVACRALEAGKHVLVEGPFGESPEQASELLDLAAELEADGEQQLVFQGDFELGYIPVLHRVRQMLADGPLGRPLSVTARLWCDWGLDGKAESPESTRIGFFVWTGPWYLQIVDVLIGKLPRRVSAHGIRALNGALMDHGWVSLDYGENLVGRFEYSLLAAEGQAIEVEVVTTDGEARADLNTGDLRWRTPRQPQWQSVRIPPAEPIAAFAGMRECLTSFLGAIADGGAVLADVAACRRLHQICFAAQRSADQESAVALADD
ncbi:MAG: Gfo/Idh/MocA family oxidoreductase [Gemmatimonadetes bacterium]|nr:Gfo/Idh/MocA family oxidoreductase [Gemmatimonadota bacterium]